MLTVPAPPALNGDALGAQLIAAGINDAEVVLSGAVIVINGHRAGRRVGEDDRPVVEQVVAAHDGAPLPPPPERVNEATVDQRLEQAITNLRTFVESTKPSTAAAQASAAYDAAKLCSRVLVGLIRLRLRRLDAVD